MKIELLESRIAPAAVTFVNAKTATFTDVDGDTVTVSLSKSVFTTGNVESILQTSASGSGYQLEKINLAPVKSKAKGANLTVSVTTTVGNGSVNVGYLDSYGADLGNVTISGDLAKFTVGDKNKSTPALKSLTVGSLGNQGTDTGAANTESFATGIKSLEVEGNMTGSVYVIGNLKSVTIGGSLDGSTASGDGFFFVNGKIGNVHVSGNVIGGSHSGSGSIATGRTMGNVQIDGSLSGGSGFESGDLYAGKGFGNITIGGNFSGGSASHAGEISTYHGNVGNIEIHGSMLGGNGSSAVEYAGAIEVGGKIKSITISSSLTGGSAGKSSGEIYARGNIGPIDIGGSVTGGNVSDGSTHSFSGSIVSDSNVASIHIGGNLVAGAISGSGGTLNFSGAISVGGKVDSVAIDGSIIGNDTNAVTILAGGHKVKGNHSVLGSLSVGDDVTYANILAGYFIDYSTTSIITQSADVAVGNVTVGGDWEQSVLVVGVENTGSNAGFLDAAAEALISGGSKKILSSIASITITGNVFGTVGSGDTFGFAAEKLGTLSINGSAVALTSGAHNDSVDLISGTTADVYALEV